MRAEHNPRKLYQLGQVMEDGYFKVLYAIKVLLEETLIDSAGLIFFQNICTLSQFHVHVQQLKRQASSPKGGKGQGPKRSSVRISDGRLKQIDGQWSGSRKEVRLPIVGLSKGRSERSVDVD